MAWPRRCRNRPYRKSFLEKKALKQGLTCFFKEYGLHTARVGMIYLREKQKNGTCNGCGHTSWKYEDSAAYYGEEICLDSRCRYRVVNGSGEIMTRALWEQTLSGNAEPHLTLAKI